MLTIKLMTIDRRKEKFQIMSTAQHAQRQGRIPLALQAVFLASNRGKEVNKPPPNRVCNKVFKNNWFFQRMSCSGKKVKEKKNEDSSEETASATPATPVKNKVRTCIERKA